jgi:hypothetical protein
MVLAAAGGGGSGGGGSPPVHMVLMSVLSLLSLTLSMSFVVVQSWMKALFETCQDTVRM